jgi:hypothetical protein
MRTQEATDQITRLIKLGKGDVNRDIVFFISTIDDPTSRMLVFGLLRRILSLKQSGKNPREDPEVQLYSEALLDYEGGDTHVY